jgi:hypothetical protein
MGLSKASELFAMDVLFVDPADTLSFVRREQLTREDKDLQTAKR